MKSQDWIDVKEKLPRMGERVLCKLPPRLTPYSRGWRILYRMRHNGKWSDYDGEVTHWMRVSFEELSALSATAIIP